MTKSELYQYWLNLGALNKPACLDENNASLLQDTAGQKISWAKVSRLAVYQVFANGTPVKDGLIEWDHSTFIAHGDYQHFRSLFSWKKFINPLKYLEFVFAITAFYADRLGQAFSVESYDRGYGFGRKLFRGFCNILSLPYLLLRPITSPMKYLLRPLGSFIKKHPWISLLILASTVLLVAFVALSVFSGGTLPAALGFLGFAAPVIKGIAIASSFFAAHIPLLSSAIPVVMLHVVNSAFVVTSVVAGLKLFHGLARETVALGKTIFDKIPRKQKLVTEMADDFVDEQRRNRSDSTSSSDSDTPVIDGSHIQPTGPSPKFFPGPPKSDETPSSQRDLARHLDF